MALLRYFQATASLPTAKETALGDTMTQSANAAVLREVQTERLRKSKPYTVFTPVYYHWKICFQALKRSCSEEVQGKRRRWSARREVPLHIQSLLPGWHHCSALLPYLNEGCKGRAHCLSAMFDPSKELVHEVQVRLASELNQSVKS